MRQTASAVAGKIVLRDERINVFRIGRGKQIERCAVFDLLSEFSGCGT